MPEPTLGLVMILRDEAGNLAHSLAPVAQAFDEVVVVDTGSQDDTPGICAGLGARVHHLPWGHDFAAARNHSLELAAADWLLWLDGDNAIEPDHVAELRQLIRRPDPAIIWALERVEPSGQTLWQKRCFPRRPEVRFQGRVHEQLAHPPAWPQVASQVVVRHWGYADPDQVKRKGLYYLGLLEQSLQEDGDDFYTRFQAARCLFNLRRWEEAAGHLLGVTADAAARRVNPEIWLHAHLLLAQCHERQGGVPQAVKTLDHLLAQMPESGLAHYHRGRLARSNGDDQSAAHHLSKALELGVGRPFVDLDPIKTTFLALYYLGRSLQALGRGQEAAQALGRAVEVQPANTGARCELARLLLDQGDAEQARRQLHQALRFRPGDRLAQSLLRRAGEAA